MGLMAQYGSAEAARAVAWDAINAQTERNRRAAARRRLDIYSDNFEYILTDQIEQIYSAAEIKAQLQPFIPLACHNSFLKRIVNDIARVLYAVPPRRRVKRRGASGKAENDDKARETFARIVAETRLNSVMDVAVRKCRAVNEAILFVRFIPSLGLAIDVLTPAQVTIIGHPRRPAHPLAIAYQTEVNIAGKTYTHWVVWDDQQHFELDAQGHAVRQPTPHKLGRMPFVVMHLAEPSAPFDTTSGKDLEAAAVTLAFMNALTLKLHYCQGEKLIATTGDASKVQDQTADGMNILDLGDVKSVTPLDLVTDPGHYQKTIDRIETTVAANYGINRQRLNQDKEADDAALLERSAELLQRARDAEIELFEVIKLVSQEHEKTDMRMPQDVILAIDFGQVSARVDREKQLAIRETERKQGTRNVLDDIFEDNPEVVTEGEAWEELDENMAVEAKFIERRRALGISDSADMANPGQDQRLNGAMGPAVRDKKLSRDSAATMGKKGPTPEFAKRFIQRFGVPRAA